MVTKRTGRPRGRPKLEFLDDPDRYRLALIDAVMEIYALDFEPAARLALATEGRPIPPEPVQLSRAAQKRFDQGWAVLSIERIKPPQTMDAQIDNLRRKWKQLSDDAAVKVWRYNMRNAWINTLQYERCGPVAELLVFKCCEAAGEARYAKQFMLPLLRTLSRPI